jgi:LuxR family maltose regulon positive regulatory protein
MEEFPVRRINSSTEPGFEKLRILLSLVCPEMAHLLTDVAHRIELMDVRPDDEINFSGTGYTHEYKYSDLARGLIALGRASEVLPLLERLTEGARSMGRLGDEIRYLVLNALAHHSLENIPLALDNLNQALTLAELQGYVRLFVDEGPPMVHLLTEALSREITPDYVQRLLRAFPVDETEKAGLNSELIEPLSEREIEVLQLIAQGLSNREVGDRLYLTINTVKAHTRTIYSKLGVNNRTQAVAKARALAIISDR